MRIIAGEYRSRKIETRSGNQTRPTLDKVREAVFSSLGGMFDGGTVLDLYASNIPPRDENTASLTLSNVGLVSLPERVSILRERYSPAIILIESHLVYKRQSLLEKYQHMP